jgi:ClpP class serine protease
MTKLAALATRHAGRALLLTPDAALSLAMRIRDVDARAFERPSRLAAVVRKLGSAARSVVAWDDDGDLPPPIPMEERLAYNPRWLGEPDDAGYCWTLKDGVALMNCDTPLLAVGEEFCGEVYHGYDTLLRAMREANADERVRARFLRLDCPGGIVDDGLIALSTFMRETREEAGGKPIWVYVNQACSAAYWIAAQADRIISGEFGYVGSIGAVIVHEDRSEQLKEDGITVTPFVYGEEKVDGAWWAKLSESARASFQSDVTQCGERFVEEVVAGRSSFTAEALIATRARVYMARHADPERSGEAMGFVDAVMGEEAAFAELLAHIQSAPEPKTSTAPTETGSLAAQQSKEKPMATPAQKALAAAQARTAALKAQLQEAEKAEKDATSAAEETGEGDEDDEKDDDIVDDEGKSKSDAAKISASAEAGKHPNLALTAITTGQTFEQFQANVAAVSAAPKTKAESKLDRVLANSQRLGPDGANAQAKGGSAGAAMEARAKANRDKIAAK